MSIQKKHSIKRIVAYITFLCMIFLNTQVLGTQAWIIRDTQKFIRNILIIIFATIVVLAVLVYFLKDTIGNFAGKLLKKF